jgi:hypothetical protein
LLSLPQPGSHRFLTIVFETIWAMARHSLIIQYPEYPFSLGYPLGSN